MSNRYANKTEKSCNVIHASKLKPHHSSGKKSFQHFSDEYGAVEQEVHFVI